MCIYIYIYIFDHSLAWYSMLRLRLQRVQAPLLRDQVRAGDGDLLLLFFVSAARLMLEYYYYYYYYSCQCASTTTTTTNIMMETFSLSEGIVA